MKKNWKEKEEEEKKRRVEFEENGWLISPAKMIVVFLCFVCVKENFGLDSVCVLPINNHLAGMDWLLVGASATGSSSWVRIRAKIGVCVSYLTGKGGR